MILYYTIFYLIYVLNPCIEVDGVKISVLGKVLRALGKQFLWKWFLRKSHQHFYYKMEEALLPVHKALLLSNKNLQEMNDLFCYVGYFYFIIISGGMYYGLPQNEKAFVFFVSIFGFANPKSAILI